MIPQVPTVDKHVQSFQQRALLVTKQRYSICGVHYGGFEKNEKYTYNFTIENKV